jgi:hypothetical protein
MKLQPFSWQRFLKFLVVFTALQYFENLFGILIGWQPAMLATVPVNNRQVFVEIAKLLSFALIFTLFSKTVVEEN